MALSTVQTPLAPPDMGRAVLVPRTTHWLVSRFFRRNVAVTVTAFAGPDTVADAFRATQFCTEPVTLLTARAMGAALVVVVVVAVVAVRSIVP